MRKAQQSEDMMYAMNDTLIQTVNKNGELQSQKVVYMAQVGQLKSLVKSKDSVISKLAKDVKRATIARGFIASSTHDTLFVPVTEYVKSPCDTFKRQYFLKDKWGEFNITAMNDRVMLAYGIKNASTVDIKWQKQGLFKRSLPVVIVTDHNPNTTTSRIEFLVVKKPPLPWWTYALPAVGGFILGKL